MARILIVDDQPNIVRLLQMTLEAEHEILTAYDGEEALKVVANTPPDMVVLDVVMPGMDGFRVLDRMKSDPETAKIPVILLTVRDRPDDIVFGLTVGADYYVPKPFKPEDIASMIRHHFAAQL